jgi:hypothetical protein
MALGSLLGVFAGVVLGSEVDGCEEGSLLG